jgi:hypothetical protein
MQVTQTPVTPDNSGSIQRIPEDLIHEIEQFCALCKHRSIAGEHFQLTSFRPASPLTYHRPGGVALQRKGQPPQRRRLDEDTYSRHQTLAGRRMRNVNVCLLFAFRGHRIGDIDRLRRRESSRPSADSQPCRSDKRQALRRKPRLPHAPGKTPGSDPGSLFRNRLPTLRTLNLGVNAL